MAIRLMTGNQVEDSRSDDESEEEEEVKKHDWNDHLAHSWHCMTVFLTVEHVPLLTIPWGIRLKYKSQQLIKKTWPNNKLFNPANYIFI